MKKVLLVFIMVILSSVFGNTFYVNSVTGDDVNNGSIGSPWEHISYGINLLSPGDTLNITGYFDLDLDSGVNYLGVQITNDITITGQGVDMTIVQAKNGGRAFYIPIGYSVNIKNLSIVDGNDEDSEMGGGIRNDGTLNLFNVKVSNCFSTNGGGIYSTGVLTASGITLTGNTASDNGGGIFCNKNTSITYSTFNQNNADNGAGIYFDNSTGLGFSLNMINCTFSENYSSLSGGGVFLNADEHGQGQKMEFSINSCTLARNIAKQYGSGICANANKAEMDITLKNSIFDNDIADNYYASSTLSTITPVSSYNISSDGSLPDATANGNIDNTDPMLENLADNGGGTKTHALMRISPAMNAIPFLAGGGDYNGASLDDQRGELIFNADKDMGAYEYNTNKRFFVNIDTGDNANDGSELDPWKYICHSVNNPELINGDTIDVTGIFLLNEDPDVSNISGARIYDDLIIQGHGADITFIKAHPDSGMAASRVFSIYSDKLTIEDLSIMNGKVNSVIGGAAIYTGSDLSLRNINISGCSTTGNGGALYIVNNTSIINCALFNNHCGLNGGSVYFRRTLGSVSVNIENSTISNNTADSLGTGFYIESSGGSISNPAEVTLNINSSTVFGNTFETLVYLKSKYDLTDATLNFNVKNSLFENFNDVYYAENTSILNIERSFTLSNDTTMPDGSINGNQNNVDLKLYPLANNGGGTFTHALKEDSPAVDAISISSGSGNWNGAPLLDQRGVAIINNLKDIGAFEGFISETIGIPQNVVSSIDSGELTITWDNVDGATSYIIYSSVDPYDSYNIEDTVFTNSWTGTITENKVFYYIVASNSKISDANSEISNLKYSNNPGVKK
ncbi:MAG: hypothetical protein JXN63_08885 [Candidatus Delongbacteria bacterium]|nr:hypothetical protein [Candidatus Delongbacteria bacterium]